MFSYGIGIGEVGKDSLMKDILKGAISMGYKSQIADMGFGLVLMTETEMNPEHIENIRKINGVADIAVARLYRSG
jgi:hypothetical protein